MKYSPTYLTYEGGRPLRARVGGGVAADGQDAGKVAVRGTEAGVEVGEGQQDRRAGAGQEEETCHGAEHAGAPGGEGAIPKKIEVIRGDDGGADEERGGQVLRFGGAVKKQRGEDEQERGEDRRRRP